MRNRARPRWLALALALAIVLVTGCGRPVHTDRAPSRPADVSRVPDAVPRYEPRSSRGNPDSYEVFGQRYYVLESANGHVERGVASWYGEKFHGRLTSSGEPYDMYVMTAAHKTLPLPTYARVTNLANGRSVVVKINDPPNGVYYIDNGSVNAIDNGGKLITTLTAGNVFGEMAYFSSTRTRNATIIANSDVVLRRISREDFEKLPVIMKIFQQISAKRKRNRGLD